MRVEIPTPVLISAALLTAVHAVGLWQMVLLSRTTDVPLWMPYSTLAVLYSLLAVALTMVLLGKRWARTIFAILAAFAVLSALGRLAGMAGFLTAAVKVLAVVLLYVPTSDAWFNRNSSETQEAGPP